MTTRTSTKLIALTLGATLSMTCLGTVMVGMHSASAPAPAARTIELPTVVVVGTRHTPNNATALATSTRANKV